MSVKNLVLRSNNLQKKWRSLQTEMGSAIAGTGSLISRYLNPWEKSRLSTDWCRSSRCSIGMQVGTVSGTAADHPNGDRYLFVLQPGEASRYLLQREARLPGPMMPYHCALPVIDRAASKLWVWQKGIVSAPLSAVFPMNRKFVLWLLDPHKYRSMMLSGRKQKKDVLQRIGPRRLQYPQCWPLVAVVAVEEEAVSITELSFEQNRDLLESVLRGNSEGARIFRVENTLMDFLPSK